MDRGPTASVSGQAASRPAGVHGEGHVESTYLNESMQPTISSGHDRRPNPVSQGTTCSGVVRPKGREARWRAPFPWGPIGRGHADLRVP